MPAQTTDSALALKGLQLADFDAVAHVDSVWDDSISLAEDLHHLTKEKILRFFHQAPQLIKPYEASRPPINPLNLVYSGVAGSGKTQLLSQIRRQVMAAGHHFVLIDMTGVNRFYPTVCLKLIESLSQRAPNGYLQIELVLAHLFRLIENKGSEEQAVLKLRSLAGSPDGFEEVVAKITDSLSLRFAGQPNPLRTDSRKDVLRALLVFGLLNGDSRADAAYDWLQGGELDEDLAKSLQLSKRKLEADHIIKAITWFMGFRAPTMFAFDQLDVIVNQFETASRGGNTETAAAAKAAVLEIVGGLSALWEQAYRSQILISCLHLTWDILKGNILVGLMDRFIAQPFQLAEISKKQVAMKIVELRLESAYKTVGFHPPYPTYPFTDLFFEVGVTPRSLLQKCLEHRSVCVEAGAISETSGNQGSKRVDPSSDGTIDQEYAALLKSVSIHNLDAGTNESENDLGALLDQICRLLIIENPPPSDIDAKVDLDPASSGKTQSGLHARLHLTLTKQNDREEFFCLRALQTPTAVSFQSRLRAAITDSGVNLKMPFRRLVIVRNQPVPSGKKTAELKAELIKQNGQIVPLPEAELRALAALKSLADKKPEKFNDWLSSRKPLRQLNFIRETFQDYFALLANQTEAPPSKPVDPQPAQPPSTSSQSTIVLGRRLTPLDNSLIELPIANLTRHLLIRAGAGGGKTVLLKRLIESAALSGVPSIVLDPGNDLAFLGDSWPHNPSAWLPNDPARAASYHDRVEVVIWTPGRSGGRPLGFSPLPDFTAVMDDADDFNFAVSMAAGSLVEATGANKGASAGLKKGLLTAGIRLFAERGGKTLTDLVDFLRDLPFEAQGGIAKAPKLAADMADNLQATLLGNKTLMPVSGGNTISEVLGIGAAKTRISVVSLAGLSETNGERLAFVNQLAVSLFTWIRKNPSQKPGQVRGLFVVDEAKDFIPSVKVTECKESLMRVAAQARKYGFGLMLATQNPTDIDHKAANNCATQFFGRAASPNVVDAMGKAIEELGGNAPDLTQLGKGQFYFSSTEALTHPVRVQVPICLSYHPDGQTLTDSDILIRSRKPLEA